MALMVDQPQSNFKHYCKICKKGFGCGRALGGHMRAHGIGDESCHLDDEDPASDREYKLGSGNDPPKNKRMYALRTNPNRLKACRVCENCGKQFLSWKSFLEHGKCSSEDADESLVSSPGSEYEDDAMEEDGMARRNGCGNWSKRKRSFRTKVGDYNNPNCPSSEEEDLANCLMMLSNATVDPMLLMAEPEESCASASKEEERSRNTMNFITPSLACPNNSTDHQTITTAAKNNVNSKGLFECKACKKVFNSHQALGGHRASHKKVKGCFAARLDNHHRQGGGYDHDTDEDVITHEEFFPTKSNSTLQFDHGSNGPLVPPSGSKRKSKVHECSICHRVFSSGQALGGHKRCHWITSNSTDASSLPKFHQFHDQIEQIQQNAPKFIADNEPLDLTLDLNLPASATNQPGFNVSTQIFLQSWIGVDVKEKGNLENDCRQQNEDDTNKELCDSSMKNNDNNDNKNNDNNNVDDEADSKVKLAKLSELKDMSGNGSSSPWLQVGICSTAHDVVADP